METITLCPNGHEVGDGEPLCTICWTRVAQAAEESTSRRRSPWPPSPAAAAVVGGILLIVGVGGAVFAATGSVSSTSTVVAEAPAPADQPVVVAAPQLATVEEAPADGVVTAAEMPATEEPATVAAPAAATVVVPVTLTTCVPAATDSVKAKARATSADVWQAVASELALGDQGACAATEVTARVTVAEPPVDAAQWKLTAFAANGDKISSTKDVSAQ